MGVTVEVVVDFSAISTFRTPSVTRSEGGNEETTGRVGDEQTSNAITRHKPCKYRLVRSIQSVITISARKERREGMRRGREDVHQQKCRAAQ